MIIVKKTAVLSPRGAHGVCGVARFECFKEKSDVRINLSGGRKDLYAVVAVGDEKKVVKLSGDRIYLTRSDLSGDCAVIVADGKKRVLCAGATSCRYDFSPLEAFLFEAFGNGADREDGIRDVKKEEIEAETKEPEEKKTEQGAENVAKADAETADASVNEAKEEVLSAPTRDESRAIAETEEKSVGTTQDEKTEKVGKTGKRASRGEERFFDKISDKIEKLFKENEKDEELTALIPDSRWARVRTDDGWYVVGVAGDPAEFIMYGIPADNASDPPEEDEGCRQWLEIEKGGRGYWMMYQSAESGETLTAI